MNTPIQEEEIKPLKSSMILSLLFFTVAYALETLSLSRNVAGEKVRATIHAMSIKTTTLFTAI
ncbi:MAG: hypothetical protein PHX62_03745 [Bacilli bacterium]|nr:hypothetical protein [Bacilli bacterium]